MFGYVTINKQELKIKEYDKYQSYYCGLCRSLKKSYGFMGQLTLSYDMTFAVSLLNALYEPECVSGYTRCAAHPLVKHATRESIYSDYCADMNLYMAYEKCIDDWKDEKKISRLLYSFVLRNRVKKIKDKYPEKTAVIADKLKELSVYEKNNERSIDFPSGCFGKIMEEVLACHKDEWEEDLREMGFYLGKFIYIMDAYEDRDKDIKKGNYNPLNEEDDVESFLLMMMSECCKAFERLPIVEDVEILRNILYSGVWGKYEIIKSGNKKDCSKKSCSKKDCSKKA